MKAELERLVAIIREQVEEERCDDFYISGLCDGLEMVADVLEEMCSNEEQGNEIRLKSLSGFFITKEK